MNPRSDIHDRLAASLREARKARGLSLDAVAKLSGVSRSMVSQIERGESSPTVATLWNLTQALQVDFAGLLEGRAEPGIVVIRAAAAALRTRCGWWGGALSQISSFGTPGRIWPSSIIAVTTSSVRQRRSGRQTISPVTTFSAPKSVRRALRPLITTGVGWPTRLQPARKGGNSRSAVSSATHTSPPTASMAAAAAITAPFFRGKRDRAAPTRTAGVSSGSRDA